MARRGAVVILAWALAANGWLAGAASAAWVESLVMPGEVVAKHARVEQQCGKCHERFDKNAQDGLCLSCHTDVAADLAAKIGFHGREPSVLGRACRNCHTEHKGRDADIVHFDRQTFEHRSADMMLRGAHAKVACVKCHKPDKRFREALPLCNDCHGHNDPHQASLGSSCDHCHDESEWKSVRFDHATAFALEGRHRTVKCEGCHVTKRYKPTATTCVACHERHDKHHGHVGKECASCHTPRAWAQTKFDHARDAHFALLGAHVKVSCESCHKNGVAKGQTPTTCIGCHSSKDAHQGQFGHACETCHAVADWRRPTFQHDRDTRYPLRGQHAEVRCTDCHRGDLHAERLATSCNSCHRDDDVHRGRQGAHCESCHDERGWGRDVLFDHDTTKLKLSGAHARVACKQCHLAPSMKDVGHACLDCHRTADVHRGKLGTGCGGCHSDVAWRPAKAATPTLQ
ncbi:MAG: cytochrome C [Deltaproteobacteria bacterium]|nr:cytochrome C [Deltaproteobacteria bacterium]